LANMGADMRASDRAIAEAFLIISGILFLTFVQFPRQNGFARAQLFSSRCFDRGEFA